MSTKFVILAAGGLPPARTLITNFVLSLFSGLDMIYIYIICIYMYIYAYIYICIVSVYLYIYLNTCICICACVYVSVYVCVSVRQKPNQPNKGARMKINSPEKSNTKNTTNDKPHGFSPQLLAGEHPAALVGELVPVVVALAYITFG